MQETRKDIRTLSFNDLETWFSEQKQPKFRSKQVFEWLWKKSAHSFDEMTNLSKELRSQLETNFFIHGIEVASSQ